MTPSVSVLIAVHNGLPYVESALRSIMEQTLRDIEIVVVDDASTDATPEVLARLAAEDPRIRVETLETNRRLPGALNRGLELVRAPLVARMDADDIAYPERLAVQKAYMDAHPEVTLVATSYRQIDENGRHLYARSTPLSSAALRWQCRFRMPVCHPTFLYRRHLGNGTPIVYDSEWSVTEDYDLVARVSWRDGAVCLPDMLLDYRVFEQSVSRRNADLQSRQARVVADCVQRSDLPEALADALAPFMEMQYDFATPTPERLRGAASAFRRVIRQDAKKRPDLVPWMRRQAAMSLFHILHRDMGKRDAMIRLARAAPDFAMYAGLRFAESRYGLFARQPKV